MVMKRRIGQFTAVLLTLAVLSGCGANEPANTQQTAAAVSTTAASEETTASAAESAKETEPAKETTAPAELKIPEMTFESDPIEYSKAMKLGWNLGNTLDASGASDLTSETSWGQPVATRELIEFVAKSGFTSIRIPVSWGRHTDDDLNIDPEWMDRVNTIVDYAVECGLRIIINSHHDCDYYYPTEKNYDKAEKFIKAVWTQIADRFADYDERLVFESMNEPRLMNTSKEWWFQNNDPEGIESIKCIMKLNQVFVDTVRASGGNNGTRFLMVPSNAASPANAFNREFEMPEDPANRLILSVHAYTPYDFAMNANGYTDWSDKRENDIKDFMSKLNKRFLQKGYGVVIGEFGATNKGNLDERAKWADSYTKLAVSYGYPCFLWDNGGTGIGEENFGMIDRYSLSIFYPEILNAMLANYNY